MGHHGRLFAAALAVSALLQVTTFASWARGGDHWASLEREDVSFYGRRVEVQEKTEVVPERVRSFLGKVPGNALAGLTVTPITP
ncbi:hypothetical protein T484DRAFT_1812759 [Baffinella frigidus]|nr:hypothetical protein T484DRAFT_1812759 [Cryptophyta sp. CCMP2293]